MNILFLAQYPILPHNGGIERVSYILATEFKKKGHNIFFFSLTPKTDKDLTDDASDFPQYYIDKNYSKGLENFSDLIKNLKIDIIINQHLIKEALPLLKNIDHNTTKVISVLHNRPFHTVGLERKMKQLSYPTTLKGNLMKIMGIVFPKIYGKARLNEMKSQTQSFLEVSDRFFLLSDKFKDRLQQFLPGIDMTKINAINNPNTFDYIKEYKGQKENLMLFVGRLEDPQKNVKGFIDVWNAFYPDHKDWKAYIIGDGPHKAFFEKYAQKTKSQNLTFTGNVRNVAEYYAKAKILCLSSIFEGWGMVLTEAMAYGCIPAAYDTYESLHEIIEDGKTGLIAKRFDRDDMVDKINLVADNEDLRVKMEVNAIKSIERFNASRIAENWIKETTKIIDDGHIE